MTLNGLPARSRGRCDPNADPPDLRANIPAVRHQGYDANIPVWTGKSDRPSEGLDLARGPLPDDDGDRVASDVALCRQDAVVPHVGDFEIAYCPGKTKTLPIRGISENSYSDGVQPSYQEQARPTAAIRQASEISTTPSLMRADPEAPRCHAEATAR